MSDVRIKKGTWATSFQAEGRGWRCQVIVMKRAATGREAVALSVKEHDKESYVPCGILKKWKKNISFETLQYKTTGRSADH